MKLLGRLALGALAVVLVIAVVVAVRTATFRPPASGGAPVTLAGSVPIDRARAAQRLGQAIRFRTISNQDPAQNDAGQFLAFQQWLQQTYPAAHAAMRREVVGATSGYGALLYTWQGSDASLAPVVLMAHQDVVPVDAATLSSWRHPAFEGVVADGAVWGRGAIDDKGSLVALFEAADALAARGFEPRRTLIIASGHDEEAGGSGARAIAALMTSRGQKAEFVLDEGLAVTADNPVTGGPTALIGTAEKGYATLRLTAVAEGGHSSMPQRTTAVTELAGAIQRIVGKPFPLRFAGPGADMLRTLAADAPWTTRMAVANEWLFGPVLTSQAGATPAGAAMLHTTIAPTMLEGSPKENVLPQRATALINYRIAPQDSSAAVMARAKAAVGDAPVRLDWSRPPVEPSPVSSRDSRGWRILSALAAEVTKAPVAPGLVMAGTDSRYLKEVATDTYRFQPITASIAELKMIHGVDEHLTDQNLARMLDFYARLMATAGAS